MYFGYRYGIHDCISVFICVDFNYCLRKENITMIYILRSGSLFTLVLLLVYIKKISQ